MHGWSHVAHAWTTSEGEEGAEEAEEAEVDVREGGKSGQDQEPGRAGNRGAK